MAIFDNSVANIIATFLITSLTHKRLAPATRLLKGLKSYHISAAGADLSNPLLADSQKPTTERSRRHTAVKVKKQENDLGEAAAVRTVPLSASQIESAAFFGYLDYMIALLPATVANCLLSELYQAFGVTPSFFPAVFATLIIGLTLRALLEVTVLTDLSPSFDKGCSLAFGLLAGMVALAVLVLAPPDVLSFDIPAACKGLSQALGGLLRSRATTPEGKHIPDPSVPPVFLEVALASLGAVLGGLLLTPVMRVTRSFASATAVPDWGTAQLSFPTWAIGCMQLNLILPAVATMLWVTPLLQEPLSIPEEWMPASKAAVLLSIAIIQLIDTRSLVQSYLNSGLKQWHKLKHGSRSSTQGVTTSGAIAMKLRIINTLAVKVAIQCIAPAVILIGCAVLILHPSFSVSPVHSQSLQAEMFHGLLRFWVCIADFCGWWTCACWFFYAAASLALLKARILQA